MSVNNIQMADTSAFCDQHPQFSEGQIRSFIFRAKDNGLEDIGAIIRIGRRVYIDIPRFFKWVEGHRTGTIK